MIKYFLVGFLLMAVCLTSAAGLEGQSRYNLLSFRQLDAEWVWSQTGNPASMSQMPDLFPARLSAGAEFTQGNFHSVFQGNSSQSFLFDTESYRKIGKVYLWGSFKYNKSAEREVNFTNTNNPVFNQPYLLTDTLGNEVYSREFFHLRGSISSSLTDWLDWGIGVGYQVGAAAQTRDPRALNKVVHFDFAPGLIFRGDRVKLGAGLSYAYYNEDIDLLVVRESGMVTAFQLLGLGNFQYHVSSSFFRLYQQQELGAGAQLEWHWGALSNLLHSGFTSFDQTIDDGRMGSVATWAVTKNDAKLDGRRFKLFDILTISRAETTHQLQVKLETGTKLGTEFIQRLEKVNETELERWVTYGSEQKYYSKQSATSIIYQLISKDAVNQMRSLFGISANYLSFAEYYYVPNESQSFSNLGFSATFAKLMRGKSSCISAEVDLAVRIHLGGRQNLATNNFVVQKITQPEFNYQTKNYLAPSISAGYQIPFEKIGSEYFLKANCGWIHAVGPSDQIQFGMSTGLIF